MAALSATVHALVDPGTHTGVRASAEHSAHRTVGADPDGTVRRPGLVGPHFGRGLDPRPELADGGRTRGARADALPAGDQPPYAELDVKVLVSSRSYRQRAVSRLCHAET